MKKLFVVLAAIFLLAVTSCGGGGGNSNTDNSNGTTNISLQSNVSVIDENNSKDIAIMQTTVGGKTSINLTANSALGSALKDGSVISILPGADGRYPLGLSAKVESVITNPDGTKQVVLQPATIADIVSSSTFQTDSIPLNADNFVGVIAPQATSPALSARVKSMLLPQSGKTALKGGIIVTNGSSSLSQLFDYSGQTKSGKGNVSGGDVSVNLKLNLKDMGIDASKMKPYGLSGEAGFEINGSIKNIKLTKDHDFSLTSGLKSLNLQTTGDIQMETKFTGNGSATLGYYSQAWKEVENEQTKILGFSGKLSGLSSKDKIGKFPIAGLVWAVGCPPSGCQIIAGNTQTPLRTAKSLGVILWIYLTASGEIAVEGSFGARINPGEFALGVTKTDGGKLDIVHELSNSGSGRLIEVPFIDGKINTTEHLGTAIDLDFFLLGIRMANASLDVEGRFVADIDGTISYGTNKLGDPWGWDGNACISTQVGAGAIFAAGLQVGVEVETSWEKTIGTEFAYEGQWPSESEILTEGWHGIGNATWYTAGSVNVCYPTPTTTTTSTTTTSSTTNNSNSTTSTTTTNTTTTTLAATYSISGTVSGDVASGVTITLTGTGSKTYTTGPSGYYIFSGAANGNYTITPSMTGYTFNPTSSSITVNNANVTGKNFTATALSSEKAIVAYSLGSYTGTINETNKTIAVTVPYGTDVTALIATFATTGASIKVGSTIQGSGTTANDFTSPVTYTVTATDATTQNYIVTVTIASGGTWTKKADFGGGVRSSSVSFSIGSKGYIGTGSMSGSYKKDFWEYDPATNIWTQMADFGGEERSGAAGFSIGNKGYIGTGFNGSHKKDFWEYDPATNIWTQMADFAGGERWVAIGFSIGSKGYIGTGSKSGSYKKDFWEYDPVTNIWTQKADFGGTARGYATGFSIGSKGYVGMGSNDAGYTFFKDFWEYDQAANTWTQKADLGGVARCIAIGFSIGSKGYIGTGVYSPTSSCKDFWEYNPATNIWTQKADFGGTARGDSFCFSIGNKGYIGAGYSNTPCKDFWEYSP